MPARSRRGGRYPHFVFRGGVRGAALHQQLGGAGFGTACFETCKTDPTSDPDAETCGGDAGIGP